MSNKTNETRIKDLMRPKEIEAATAAAMDDPNWKDPMIIRHKDLMVSFRDMYATMAGEDLHLTLFQIRLLSALIVRPYDYVSVETLILRIWRENAPETRLGSLFVLIKSLRIKLGGKYIHNLKRMGYCLDCPKNSRGQSDT